MNIFWIPFLIFRCCVVYDGALMVLFLVGVFVFSILQAKFCVIDTEN